MIRKAVIPAAGLGTRMLPLTKTQPKEMLPLGRKPCIQYIVEELARWASPKSYLLQVIKKELLKIILIRIMS